MNHSELRAKLDPVHAAFCDMYLQRDITLLTSAQIMAAIRPDLASPGQAANRILKRSDVQDYLSACQFMVAEQVSIGIDNLKKRIYDDVLTDRERYPYLDWLPVYDDDGKITYEPHVSDVDDIPLEDRCDIVMLEESPNGMYKVTLRDKLAPKDRHKALEMLVRMHGGFSDNVNQNLSGGVTLTSITDLFDEPENTGDIPPTK